MKKKLLIATMLMATIITTVFIPQSKNVVHAATQKVSVIGVTDESFQKSDQPTITLFSFQYQWVYRVANKRLEKRLFNNTTGNWASGSSWILVQ